MENDSYFYSALLLIAPKKKAHVLKLAMSTVVQCQERLGVALQNSQNRLLVLLATTQHFWPEAVNLGCSVPFERSHAWWLWVSPRRKGRPTSIQWQPKVRDTSLEEIRSKLFRREFREVLKFGQAISSCRSCHVLLLANFLAEPLQIF